MPKPIIVKEKPKPAIVKEELAVVKEESPIQELPTAKQPEPVAVKKPEPVAVKKPDPAPVKKPDPAEPTTIQTKL